MNIVRHPKTPWNELNMNQSFTDVALDAGGLADAKGFAWALRSEKIDLVVATPLKRSWQAAEIIAQAKNAPLIIAKGLTERRFGELEGKDHIATRNLRHQFLINQKDNPFGIETDDQLRKRVTPVIKHLVQAYMGMHLLLVDHSSLMRYLIHKFAGRSYEGMYAMAIDNGSMIKILSDGGEIVASPNPITVNF